MLSTTRLYFHNEADVIEESTDDSSSEEVAAARLPREAARQHAREEEVRLKTEQETADFILASTAKVELRNGLSAAELNASQLSGSDAVLDIPVDSKDRHVNRIRQLIEMVKSRKTTKLLLQIWQSDYSIIGFVVVMGTFYIMKDTHYGPIGVLFFLFAMAEIDAILSIFVVRLSFHQNKHGFYRTEDFERDWLRYRMLLSMTKAALLFVVATSCGPAAVIASYLMWFFTSTLRLRYIILRWSMDDHYPDLQRWSIFALLREAGIEPKLRNFNILAILGVVIAFTIAFLF